MDSETQQTKGHSPRSPALTHALAAVCDAPKHAGRA